MKLVFPDITYKDRAIGYIREFYEYGSQINGSGSLDRFLRESTYEEWLKKIYVPLTCASKQLKSFWKTMPLTKVR